MERKRYLELCQKYAVGCDIRVLYKKRQYHPYRYELGFDNKGKSIHTAILKDVKANSVVCTKIDELVYVCCENCCYYNDGRKDEPCCSCADWLNFEKEGEQV